MNTQWSMIWTYSNATSRPRHGQEAFADPLERPEWRGLEWAAALLSKLISPDTGKSLKKQPMTNLGQLPGRVAATRVCVS